MTTKTTNHPSLVNLTALAEARAKMTPGEYEDGVSLSGNVVARDGVAVTCVFYAGDPANRAGIVATHNAADVLIEVARIAKLYADTRDVAAHRMLLDALAKVSL